MKSIKIRLEFNNEQQTNALQHCGVARHAWNWGLSVCKAALERKEKCPSAIDLHKKLVAEVKNANPWYYDVSKCAPQQALRDLNTAFTRCFKKVSKFPQFKKRGQKDSFYTEGAIQLNGDYIKLPRFGWVKMSEKIASFSIKNCVVSRTAHCDCCGHTIDRDLNAAINLKAKAVSYTVSNACGGVNKPKVQRPRTPMKQETNSGFANG